MAEARTWWETIKGESGELLEGVKALIREGNVRRIVIRQGDRSVAEFPLTVGVVGTVGAPVLAAVGAIVALLTNCSIAVQREAAAVPSPAAPEPPGPPVEAQPSEPPAEASADASPSESPIEASPSEAPVEPPLAAVPVEPPPSEAPAEPPPVL